MGRVTWPAFMHPAGDTRAAHDAAWGVRRARLCRSRASDESQTDFGQNLGVGVNFRRARFQPFVEGRFHFFNDVQFFTLSAAMHL